MASRQKLVNQVIRKGYLTTKENQSLMYNNTKGKLIYCVSFVQSINLISNGFFQFKIIGLF